MDAHLTDFRNVLMKHNSTGYAYHDQVQRLVELSWEHRCTIATNSDSDVSDLERQIMALANQLGVPGAAFSRDPRGATVRLLFPDGFSDSVQGGYCVPT